MKAAPFGPTGRTALLLPIASFRVFLSVKSGFRRVPGTMGDRYPRPPVPFCFQAAFGSPSRAMRLPISRVLAVWMPKNIQSVSVALVRAPYPPEAVMLLVVAEAALKAAGPFLRYGPRQFFPLPFMFAGPSLPLEVGTDIVPGGELPVFVVGIDGIAPGDLDLGPCEALDIEDGLAEPNPLVERVEGKVLDKADAVHLELVHLGPELHGLFLLAPDYRPDVGPVQTDDAANGAHAFVEQGILLFPCLFGRRPAYILVHGKGKAVRPFHAVQFQGELFRQQEQGPCQCPPLLLGLPFHLAVGDIAPFPLQVPAAGHGGPFSLHTFLSSRCSQSVHYQSSFVLVG